MQAEKKLFIKTFGCQMNVYDSERMQDVLKPLGYVMSDELADADMVILNTCHIREKATEKVFSDLGRIRQQKEKRQAKGADMVIGVAGCVAQAEGEEIIRRAPFVDMVFGPQSYHLLPEMVTRAVREQGGVVELEFPEEQKFDYLPEAEAQGPAAFVSVQEGCDKFCTFCVVPYTRGAEYSRPVQAVLDDTKRLVDQGVVEISLLGQNVNAYHGAHADGEWSLGRLIRELAKIDGLERIRYTTSHPRDMDDDLISAHGEVDKLMPYLHLPVQAGSDKILKAMNRKHTAAEYIGIIEKLRALRPEMAFSGDFIVGFPGETDEDFEATMRVVETVNYASAYSFKYSPRPGTPASASDTQVDEAVKVERLARLQELLNHQQVAFNRSKLGQVMTILLEKPGKLPGQLVGRSPFMQAVHVADSDHLMHQLVDVRIVEARPNSLRGELLGSSTADDSATLSQVAYG
ncbi:MAG: tRNA (N6-isopentenyl adenosine(37)-C2)-methylthiotransferase MiaB [Rickettsiales bacterium]|nr:tRNA (N6-isopentenyl adenosine(37)-C2)-methylthiotransferase MiaB [Rickettsiales bacterium]